MIIASKYNKGIFSTVNEIRVDYNLMTSLRRPSPPFISGLLSHVHTFSDRLMSVETDYDASPGHNVKTPAVP